nr:immunoglobulin heavy chain junction region [Mus musculus]MBK4187104.1 immunoglobulin heavy chain junction region [Mus musculus]
CARGDYDGAWFAYW